MKILCTCPPMIGGIDSLQDAFLARGATCFCPNFRQLLSESELVELVPDYDGWIIGDDLVTRRVLEAGCAGRLRCAVRWGIGTDNVDFAAASDLGLSIVNTPGMFNEEVSDVALGYVIGLARGLFQIDRGVRAGEWPKPAGISLAGKRAAVVGFGNIGRATARKLRSVGLDVSVYDPCFTADPEIPVTERAWPEILDDADFLVLTCALTPGSLHMVNDDALSRAKDGLRIVNVARGPVLDEAALGRSLASGKVAAAALDVFEIEPLEKESPLRTFEQCVFGSHNASNTVDAVDRTSRLAIELLLEQLAL